ALGRMDHIGIAVRSIEQARSCYEDQLGAEFVREFVHFSGDFKLGIFDLNGFCIELLEPINPDGFLAKFIERKGEGVHHITLQTPNLPKLCGRLEQSGVRVVDKNFDRDSGGVDAFISPKSSHGVLIQLGENLGPLNTAPFWEKD
ncbi:MAG: hypothetical protein F4077_05230, partial [Gammaproteobacteria bacterium]|nr:hypothetical protein [Gammaproteobacteria bacterium]